MPNARRWPSSPKRARVSRRRWHGCVMPGRARRPAAATGCADAETQRLAGEFMLMPLVIAMRMPVLMQEALSFDPWRVETMRAVTEKAAAVMEGAVAAQLSYMGSMSSFWVQLCRGALPAVVSGDAARRSVHAALSRPADGCGATTTAWGVADLEHIARKWDPFAGQRQAQGQDLAARRLDRVGCDLP